jgi:hypothetical protein
MSHTNSVWGEGVLSPFAILQPSSSSIFFWDERSASANINSLVATTSSSTTKTIHASYVEGAQVHGGPVGASNSGGVGWREQSTTEKYFRGWALTKSSTSGLGSFHAPNGDDICISFGKSHTHIKDGYFSTMPTSCVPEKCHALVIAIGGTP